MGDLVPVDGRPWWEHVEPRWPSAWSCTCPCGTYLQGGAEQFHRHWLVVHRGQVDA